MHVVAIVAHPDDADIFCGGTLAKHATRGDQVSISHMTRGEYGGLGTDTEAEIADTREMIENGGHPYTRALLNSTPNLDAPLEEMRPIDGKSPAPINLPSGCAYHPRCPLATEQCREEVPGYHEGVGGAWRGVFPPRRGDQRNSAELRRLAR
jgi:oligopeptide/dipeptide ABC transporter, ATP-binding protein, C-terminal domain